MGGASWARDCVRRSGRHEEVEGWARYGGSIWGLRYRRRCRTERKRECVVKWFAISVRIRGIEREVEGWGGDGKRSMWPPGNCPHRNGGEKWLFWQGRQRTGKTASRWGFRRLGRVRRESGGQGWWRVAVVRKSRFHALHALQIFNFSLFHFGGLFWQNDQIYANITERIRMFVVLLQ